MSTNTNHKVFVTSHSTPLNLDFGVIEYIDTFSDIVRFMRSAAIHTLRGPFELGSVFNEDTVAEMWSDRVAGNILIQWLLLTDEQQRWLLHTISAAAKDYRYIRFNQDMECSDNNIDVERACHDIYNLHTKIRSVMDVGGNVGEALADGLAEVICETVSRSFFEEHDAFFRKFTELLGNRTVNCWVNIKPPSDGGYVAQFEFHLEELSE